jgi:hypothetical protein
VGSNPENSAFDVWVRGRESRRAGVVVKGHGTAKKKYRDVVRCVSFTLVAISTLPFVAYNETLGRVGRGRGVRGGGLVYPHGVKCRKHFNPCGVETSAKY